ncbi:MAG: hypothetical protein M5U26_25925 [Planctomycetota bacterium]|nr:hypothetical protein [Planctomycetota bacterium]
MDERAERLEILIDDAVRVRHPGEALRGGWRYNSEEPLEVKRAEVRVFWFTEGKGDCDSGVHGSQASVEDGTLDAGRAFPFEVALPDEPWTYDGRLVKIRWAVRVNVTPRQGQEFAADASFQLRPKGWAPKPQADGQAEAR